MKKMSPFIAKGSAAALSLMLLSGCEYFKKKSEPEQTKASEEAKAGAVLCTIGGEPAITESEFRSNLNQMLQANPYFRGASAESLPKELLRRFFDQLSTQVVIEKYALKNDIEKDPEFIKAYNETEKLLKRTLMVQVFEKKLYDGIKVDDADITKHYSENKDRFVKVAGGVLLIGARFERDDLANAFLVKVKAAPDNFEKLAKADKDAKFKNFDRVNKDTRGFQQETIPAPVRETALAMNKLPGIEKVKAGKEIWVIKVWDKKDTTLFAIEEVKSHIESMLKNNKFKDELDKRVKTIKDELKVVVNEKFFEGDKKEGEKKDADQPAVQPASGEEPEAKNGAAQPAASQSTAAA